MLRQGLPYGLVLRLCWASSVRISPHSPTSAHHHGSRGKALSFPGKVCKAGGVRFMRR